MKTSGCSLVRVCGRQMIDAGGQALSVAEERRDSSPAHGPCLQMFRHHVPPHGDKCFPPGGVYPYNTLSTQSTQYAIHSLLYPLCTPSTQYSLPGVLYPHRTLFTQYSIPTIRYSHSTLFLQYAIHTVLYPYNTLSTQYSFLVYSLYTARYPYSTLSLRYSSYTVNHTESEFNTYAWTY